MSNRRRPPLNYIHTCIHVLILGLLAIGLQASPAAAQGDPVEAIIAAMSPEQRVAQLFLVTFPGNDTSDTSPAARLIHDLRVGGVVLRASRGNYTNDQTAPEQIADLSADLQQMAYAASTAEDGGPFVPLFIALELAPHPDRSGDVLPQGFTEIPSQMALGATWNAANAEFMGEVVGRELQTVGVNMVFGPKLDVMSRPRPGLSGDLGTAVFGGDPYWVSQFGRAFVRGVHAGSDSSVTVVAQHFPGLGASDRRPEEEIATIQKSLDELKRIELPPFFEATAIREDDALGVVDGVQTTHIRYRGLQGNIRQLTRPISLDAQNLPTILALPQFEAWRQDRGLLVSGELGVPAIRRFYIDQFGSFPPRQVAQEAFVANHDLLFLGNFGPTDDWQEQSTNIRSTIEFFATLYAEDAVFAQRVDRSLRRIIATKLRTMGQPSETSRILGNTFTVEGVTPAPLDDIETSPLRAQQSEIARIAQESATLVYPGREELADRLPGPPLPDEDILIFTDVHQVADCPTCEPRPSIPVDALERVLLQRYGPRGSEQLDDRRITSLTFEALDAYLDAVMQESRPQGIAQPTPEVTSPTPTPEGDISTLIAEADWLIFLMERVVPDDRPQSAALKRFLREGGDRVRSQRTIVFAMGAPYYLDATEISKLTAYFSFYTPSPTFIEAAARLLFREFTPGGAPPVSVPGINYDLITQLEPDPDQIIQVGIAEFLEEGTAEPPQTLDLTLGDTITLRTGVIVDHNGHRVPDGTPVTFILGYPNEGVELPRQEVTTRDGVAQTTVVLDREGQLAVEVVAGAATQSTTLLLTIQGEEPAEIATVVPPPTETPTPTPTATQTPTPSPTPSPPPTAVVSPTPTPSPTGVMRHIPPDAAGWHTLLFALVAIGTFGGLTAMLQSEQSTETQVRHFLLTVSSGLSVYIVYFLLWGTGILPERLGSSQGAVLIALVGGILPALIGRTTLSRQRINR